MEDFVKLLEELYSSNNEVSEDENGVDKYFITSDKSSLAYKAEEEACGYLITNEGTCNWKQIWKLRDSGYDVFAGDEDSFGWLTGCIRKHGDDRILVYG